MVEERNPRRRVQYNCSGVTRTEMNHRKEVDINSIVAKMNRGIIPHARPGATYGDFTGIVDFQYAQDRVIKAKQDFMDLPSNIRKEFDNDPGKLIGFLSNEENRERAEELGLIAKDTSQIPTEHSEPETEPVPEPA